MPDLRPIGITGAAKTVVDFEIVPQRSQRRKRADQIAT
jgi:hypothetical protein